ncbi:cilia- and flagella-associated protein 119 isoform X3 [Alligator mississippiensis]|nr:cilia- and flagella-associated protein 119 isoform X3 [Alligator mississippiensis]
MCPPCADEWSFPSPTELTVSTVCPSSPIEPQHHEAQICMWKYLDVHSMDLINQTRTIEEMRGVLAEVLQLDGGAQGGRAAILLDLYTHALWFGREQGFTPEQASALFSILHDTHQACTETPLPNLDECHSYFRRLLLCHCVRHPPFSIDLFSPWQAAAVEDYVQNTYFHHFKLYKFAFTPQVRLDLTLRYVGLPQPVPTPGEVGQAGEGALTPELQQEPEEETSPPAPPESPRAPLRTYIKEELGRALGAARQDLLEQMRGSEQRLGARLAQLEQGPGPHPRGRKK